MAYQSLLFDPADQIRIQEPHQAAEALVDLNLDQVFTRIVTDKDYYNLRPVFYFPLDKQEIILQRQQIFRDLENGLLLERLHMFSKDLAQMRTYLGRVDTLYYERYKDSWFLEATILYCDAVETLARNISSTHIDSPSLISFRSYLLAYTQSQGFTSLAAETRRLKAELSDITYCLTIQGLTVKVRKYGGEVDYSMKVTGIFQKFKQGATRDYKFSLPVMTGANHVGARILDCVAKLYPNVFTQLANFRKEHQQFIDEGIQTFDREIQFFLAFRGFIDGLKSAGLEFCLPQISDRRKDVYAREAFDIALAARRIPLHEPVVCNDFRLHDNERVFVVTGPNQGGKTTFARMFGQLHYLASLGCPIPGREGRLILFDRLFTHFEREEKITNLRGKLQDDLIRVRDILNDSSSRSIIILNELFTSTTLQDAVYLSRQIMTKLLDLDLLGVYVTFIDELSTLSQKTVSMVSTVDPKNPILRTYKIIRKPADGLSYALGIAEKRGLTYETIKARIKI